MPSKLKAGVEGDKVMAKALNYFVTTKSGIPAIRKKRESGLWDRGSSLRLPAYTSSLDAIVAEIEARGLLYMVTGSARRPGDFRAEVWPIKHPSGMNWAIQPTAPLALCAALLNYLTQQGEKR